MDELANWAPPWQRFVSWRGRLKRRAFLGGYLAVAFVGGAVSVVSAGTLMSFGLTGLMRDLMLVLYAASLVPLSALVSQRAHDIGWSALIPVGVFVVLGTPMLLFTADITGAFRQGTETVTRPIGNEIGFLALAMIGNGLWILFNLFLMIKKGQPQANRFGDAPT